MVVVYICTHGTLQVFSHFFPLFSVRVRNIDGYDLKLTHMISH